MAITPAPDSAAAEPDRGPPHGSPAVARAHGQPAASEAYRGQAGRYDRRTEAFQPWRERLVAQLPARAGDTVLDVGCGTGLCLPLLHDKVGPTGTIVGIDASEQMLQVAADRVTAHGWDNVRLVAAPAEQAPIDGPADAALFCAVHDVLQSRAALGRVIEQLRPSVAMVRGRRETARTSQWIVDSALSAGSGHGDRIRARRGSVGSMATPHPRVLAARFLRRHR